MSWSEVAQINKGIRNRAYTNAWVIENSTTWTAPSTQFYQVIAVGSGGNGYTYTGGTVYRGGGSGGVCTSILRITANTQATITAGSDSTQFSVSVSGTSVTMNAGKGGSATSGGNGNVGIGGTATGGTYNYAGNNGDTNSGATSVGCFISGVTDRTHATITGDAGTYTFAPYGILGHGIGAGGYTVRNGSSYDSTIFRATDGCVIIIPLGDYV